MFKPRRQREGVFVERARVRWGPVMSLLAGALILIPAVTLAGSQTSADFLKISLGGRGTGLGQAYTALSDGADAMNWNPAGLAATPAFASHPTVGMMLTHQEYLADTSLDNVGVVLPSRQGRSIALGLNVVRLSYGSQDMRDINQQKVGSFSSADTAVGLAAARQWGIAMLGGQFKIIRQDLAGLSAEGYAVDLGVRAPGPINRLTLGASVLNLGPQMKFIDESFQLPLTLSVGTAYRVTGPLSLLVDFRSRPYQKQTTVSAGMELAAGSSVMLRAGYLARLADAVPNTQLSETERGDAGLYGFAGGLGLHFGQFALDYAITPFGELGNTQTITLASWFGPSAAVSGGSPSGPTIEQSDASGHERAILILPLDHENWWNQLR